MEKTHTALSNHSGFLHFKSCKAAIKQTALKLEIGVSATLRRPPTLMLSDAKAVEHQIAFIEAFNAMAAFIRNRRGSHPCRFIDFLAGNESCHLLVAFLFQPLSVEQGLFYGRAT